MTLRSKLLLIVIATLMISCDSFSGCGVCTGIYEPEPITEHYRDATGKWVNMPTGRYYYPVSVEGHKIYVSYYTWISTSPGDIICVE